jgi:hypothetical protein
MKNLSLKSIAFLMISVFLNSCNVQTIDDQPTEQAVDLNFSSADLNKNITEFIVIDQNLNDKIEQSLMLNNNLQFQNDAAAQLQKCTSNADLTKLFSGFGISNNIEIIKLLEEKVKFQKLFVKNNPQFYNLTLLERTELVKSLIDKQIVLPTGKNNYETQSCASTYNTAISRCNRDALIGSSAAIIAAGAGLFPGLLAAAYVMIAHHNCTADAREDYEAC